MKRAFVFVLRGTCVCLSFLCTKYINAQESQNVLQKHEWVVESDPSSSKKADEFDAIIVGSGIGGLSCGALLVKQGYKVLVLEQGNEIGGYCTSYERNGFHFPVGAHDISGVDNGMVRVLLDALNLSKDDLFTLHTRTYTFGDKSLVFTGTKNDAVEAIAKAFPDEKEAVFTFFKEARQAADEFMASKSNPALRTPLFDAWTKVSYRQKLDASFHDEELKKLMSSLLGYVGAEPENVKASTALLVCLRYFIYGGYYPKMAGKVFSERLKDIIQSSGGSVSTNTKVDEILVKDSKVYGVRSREKIFYSNIVVANVNAKTLFLHLIPKDVLQDEFLKDISNLKMSKSGNVVNLGVDLDLTSFSSIIQIFPKREGDKLLGEEVEFYINSNVDPNMAFPHCASLTIEFSSSYLEVPPLGTAEYKAYKEQAIEKALKKLEKVIPEIRDHVRVKDVMTPRTYESYTSMPEGAWYAFDQSIGSKRPYFKTPIKGLYLASASTLYGGGVEAVVAAGLVSSRDIINHKKTLKEE